MAKPAVFALLESPKLISRKFWVIEKSWNFYTVGNDLFKSIISCLFTFLQDLDDKEFDDDEETEWQHYLRASIDCIMRVAEVFPDDVLQLVVSQLFVYNFS